MKQIYLVHGWGGNPNSEAWFKWLREECKKRNYKLVIPEMPDTDYPKIDAWVGKLKEVVKNLDEDTYFIGHSIGCQGILRYLETVNNKIGGVILVAPWMFLDANTIEEEGEDVKDMAKPWMETPINWGKIKRLTDNFAAIFSTDDPYVPQDNQEIFREKLNAKIVIRRNNGHFNDTKEIKEIFSFIGK